MGTLLALGLSCYLNVSFRDIIEKRRLLFNLIGTAVYVSFAGSIILLWQIGFVQASEVFTQLDRARDMIVVSVPKGEAVKFINFKARCIAMLDGFYLNYITSGQATIGTSSCRDEPPITPANVLSEMESGAYRYALMVNDSPSWEAAFPGYQNKIILLKLDAGQLREVAHAE